MNDDREPLDPSERQLATQLLGAARAFRPSDKARERTLAALGIAASVLPSGAGSATAANALPAPPDAAQPGAGALASAPAKLWPMAKWFLACVAVGAVGGGAYLAAGTSGTASGTLKTPTAPVAAPRSSIAPSPDPAVERAVASVELAASPRPPQAPAASAASVVAPRDLGAGARALARGRAGEVPVASGAPPAHPASSVLAEEIAALDKARRELEGSESGRALAALDDYQRRFGRGALDAEATVMRVEALARQGRHAEARALARAFLEREPNSPHRDRVRSLAADSTKPPTSASEAPAASR